MGSIGPKGHYTLEHPLNSLFSSIKYVEPRHLSLYSTCRPMDGASWIDSANIPAHNAPAPPTASAGGWDALGRTEMTAPQPTAAARAVSRWWVMGSRADNEAEQATRLSSSSKHRCQSALLQDHTLKPSLRTSTSLPLAKPLFLPFLPCLPPMTSANGAPAEPRQLHSEMGVRAPSRAGGGAADAG